MFLPIFIFITLIQISFGCIASPKLAVTMRLQNRDVISGADIQVILMIKTATPDFNATLSIAGQEITSFNISDNFRAENKTLTIRVPRTGKKSLALNCNWLGAPFTLSETVFIYKPVEDEDFDFAILNTVMYPPGVSNLRLKISDSVELPTNLTGTVDWGDGSEVLSLNYINKTLPRSSGIVSDSLTHTYNSVGSYILRVKLMNPVSAVTKTNEIKVFDKIVIKDLFASHVKKQYNKEEPSDYFRSNEDLSFSTTVENGIVKSFHFEVERRKYSFKEQPVKHKFRSSGTYGLKMWATGDGGISNIVRKTIFVQRIITLEHVDLKIPNPIVIPPGLATLTVGVTDLGELPTALQGKVIWNSSDITHFDWKEETSYQKRGTVSDIFKHNYTTPGNYSVKVWIANEVSETTAIAFTTVIPKPVASTIYVSHSPEIDDEEDKKNVYSTDRELYFNLDFMNGDPNYFHLEIDGKKKVVKNLPVSFTLKWAGKYFVRMWVTSEAGKSNVINRTIEIERNLRMSQLSLEIESLIITPPGLGTLQITIEDNEELPTAISGAIIWEESSTTNFDWKRYTAPGRLGYLSAPFRHNYLIASNYTIEVSVINRVSQITKFITARVISQIVIELIYVTYDPYFINKDDDIFASNKTLYFATDLLDGIPDLFFLEVDSNNISSEELPLNYTFSKAGTYMVNMWCTGEAGVSNVVNRTILVQKEVFPDQINLQVTSTTVIPHGLTNLDITVIDDHELPTNISGIITWEFNVVTNFDWTSDTIVGSRGKLSRRYQHNYKEASTYNIIVEISNKVSNATKTIQAFVVWELVVDGIYISHSQSFETSESVFSSNKTIFFQTDLTSGESDLFHLGIGGDNQTSITMPMAYTIKSAGKYEILMWASGAAGISNIISKAISVERIIQQDYVTLRMPDIIVTPPGEANLTLSISDDFELPTHVQGKIIWEENKVFPFDWKGITGAGVRGVLTKHFVHIYESPNNYTVTVELFNNVSSATFTTHAYVISHITIEGIYVSLSFDDNEADKDDNVFPSNEKLYFRTILTSGDAFSFHFEIDGGNETIGDLPISYIFPMAGIYVIRMWATGEASVSNTVERRIIIQREVNEEFISLSLPDIIITPPGILELNVTLDAPTELPTQVAGIIDWNDTKTESFDWVSLTNYGMSGIVQKTFEHFYATSNNYSIIFTISNNISSAFATATANVIQKLEINDIIFNDISLSDTQASERVFESNVKFSINTNVINGDAHRFHLEIEGEKTTKILETKSLPFYVFFNQSGTYTLNLWMEGMAGYSNKVSYQIVIQSKIFGGGIRVPDPPEHHPGYPWHIGYKGMISFTLEIYNPTEAPRDVEMWVDWADNSTHQDQPYSFDPGSDEKSLQKILTHVYSEPGNYSIIIKLENEVSSHLYPINVFVVPKLVLKGIVVDYSESSYNQSQNNCKDTFALENGELEIKAGFLVGVPLFWELKITCETCEWEQEQEQDQKQQELTNRNVTTKWTLRTNESDGSFFFKFNSPGWYELLLSAFGFDNDTASTSRRIFLGEYVTTLFIQIYPNITRKNFTTVVAFRSSWVYGSCLLIDLGDGTEESLYCDEIQCESEYSSRNYTTRPPNPDVIIKHAYLIEDYFYVSAKLVGPINSIEESASVSVEPDDAVEICNNLRIEIENSATRSDPYIIKKKDPVRLVSKAEISGTENCDQVTTIIEWRIRRNNDSSSNILPFVTAKTFDDISDDQELLTNVPVTNPILLIPAKTLPYGLYYITVSYTFRLTIQKHHINKASALQMDKIEEAKGLDSADSESLVNISTTMIDVTVILVDKSDLIAKFIGSSANLILRGSNQTIRLDPVLYSFDPDGVNQIVGFSWWCKKKSEEWTDLVPTEVPFPSERKESGEDLGGCFGDGPSKLDFHEGSLQLPCDLFVQIPGFYTMLVEVTSDEKVDPRKRNASLDLEIVPGSPPVLSASCNPEKSCTFIDGVVSVNPIKLVLRSSCVLDEGLGSQDRQKTIDLGDDGCGKPPVSYEWIMNGISEDNTTTTLDISEHAFGIYRFSFALLDSFWESDLGNYKLYEIKVFGAREGEHYKGKTMLMLRRNYAPENGTCVIVGVNVGSFYNEKVCGLHPSRTTNNTKTIEAVTGNSTHSSFSNDKNFSRPVLSHYYRDNTSFHVIDDSSKSNFTSEKNISEEPFWFDEDAEVVHVAALTDEVKVECSHWVDREGRGVKRYKISLESSSGRKTPLWSGNQFPAILTLPYDDIRLIGEIFDDQEAVAVFNFKEKLEMHLPEKHIYDCYDNSSTLSEAQRRQQISKVNMLLHAEKSVKPHMGQVAENSGKNAEFVSGLDKFPTTNIDEVLQATSILSTVAHPLPPGDFQGTAINSLKNLAGKTSSEGASPKLQKEFASTSLQTVASLLKNTNEDDEKFNERSQTSAKPRTDQSKQSEVDNMLNVIEGSQENILGVAVVGEEPAVVDAGESVAMAVGFFDASELEGTEVDVDGAIYIFPNYCDLLQLEEDCLANKSISIGLKMAKWRDQVYGFGGGRELLSEESSTVQLSLVDTWGNAVPVNDSRSPIIINIPRKASEFPEADLITPNMTQGQKFYTHKVEINAEGAGISFYFRPEEDPSADWIISTSLQPPYANDTNVTFYRLNELKFHTDIGFYGILLVWEDLACTNCSVFFGVAIENSTSAKDQNFQDGVVDIENLQDTFTQNYSIITFTSSCLFFDQETTSWNSRGCQVLNATTTLTVCACNHLTSFGSGFVVAPNVIDFSYVFANAGFSQNMTIYLTLIVMACLYIIGLVYTGIMDKKDKKKIGASPLPDNDPRDKYLYDIFVQTGSFPNSGTESKVNFLISGEWEDTGVRELRDPERKVLERGNKDHFVMTTARPLGPLQYLRIWHDNSGKGSNASWYFGYMIIRDIQTGDEFQFISNEWLAVEEGDGQIDRTIPLAGDSEMKAYSHLFRNTVERKLSDDHLWLSVFLRPPRSRFSRKERLSSVVALLFLAMLTSAMFYDKVPDESGAGGIHVGPFSVSPESLGVGFFTNIIVFFPTFIIITFFRKSRTRKVKPSRINQALLRQRAEKMQEMEKKQRKMFEREMQEIEEEKKRKEKERELKENAERKLSDKDLLINKDDVKSTTSSEQSQKYYEVKRGKKFRLPWWCRIIAWLLVVASIGSSIFFLWAYGIMFGDEKVKKWLTSVAVSIVTSMFITQPVKIYLLAVVFSVIFKTPLNEAEDYDDDEELMPLEYDEEYVHKMDSKKDKKKKKKRVKIGSIYSEAQLKEARERREKEVAMNKLIAEILLYLVFLSVVLCISYGSRNPLIIYMKVHYEDLFGKQHNKNAPSFLEVKSRGDIWDWAEHIFIPNIANVFLYNNVHKAKYYPQFKGIDLVDQTVTLLGRAIFRQTRIEPGNCELKHFLKMIDQSDAPKTCSGFSSVYDEQETNYTRGWKPWDRTIKCKRCDACDAFIYRSPFKVQGFPYSGRLSTYGGGGYVIELDHRNISCALRQIRELRKHRWLDEYTRGFFAEVAIYNPNINLFGVIMCVAEFLPGDGIYPVFEFQALNIYRYHAGGGLFIMISEILFVIFTIYFIRTEHAVFKKIGKKYFDSYWNWMEIMVIGLSLVIIVFYTIKSLYSLYLMDKITASKGKKYIRLQSLAAFDETTTFLIGFLLFIATVKLLKLLRFNKRIGFLSETLRACGTDLSGFALLFIVTLISFVTVFYKEAVTASAEFSTFIRSAETSTFKIAEKFKDVTQVSPVVAPIFYFIFAFIMNWIVLQVLIAIICGAFSRIKKDLSAQPNDYEVVDYMIERFLNFLSTINIRKNKVYNRDNEKKTAVEKLMHINSFLDQIIVILEKMEDDDEDEEDDNDEVKENVQENGNEDKVMDFFM